MTPCRRYCVIAHPGPCAQAQVAGVTAALAKVRVWCSVAKVRTWPWCVRACLVRVCVAKVHAWCSVAKVRVWCSVTKVCVWCSVAKMRAWCSVAKALAAETGLCLYVLSAEEKETENLVQHVNGYLYNAINTKEIRFSIIRRY